MGTLTSANQPKPQALISPKVKKLSGKIAAYLVLGAGALLVSVPWVWMLLTSLKTPADILRIPLTIWPTEWMWSNYLEVLVTSSRPLWKYVINTLIIVFFAELGVLISNTVVAFSFSRLHWKGRDMMFVLVLATMMLPAQVTMIPIFALFTAKLHWTNTYLPLIVPHFFGAPWAIFLLRQYMMTIPTDLDDAARIDGCSTFRLFSQVILPLIAPVLAVLLILHF